MRLLPFLCNKNSVLIDIRANYGIYTYNLAKFSKFVYSFEPVPSLYNNLSRAFKKFENAEIFNFGLSNING
jgi:FkbM family methyltransferase